MDVETLFQQHHASLMRYLRRYTGDRDQADDAAQETYLRLVRNPPQRAENLRAWLFTVATNVVRDTRKRQERADRLVPGPEHALVGDPPEHPQTLVERTERKAGVQRMLAKLTRKERTVLLMREEGFTHREIAQAVGTTHKSIGPTIARARRKISGDLERLMEKLQ